jgi:predicted PurR-regulated permease PerM
MRTDTDALRAPLVVLAIAAIGLVGYLARDFLIPTAAGMVLALILTPVANTLERLRLPPSLAAALSVTAASLVVAGLLAIAIPSVQGWAQQAPMLTLKLESKLKGLRDQLARIEEVSKQVERATTPTPAPTPGAGLAPAAPPEKVVVREKSLLGELASTTPVVVLQLAYAIGLALFLLSNRNTSRRQVLRIPRDFAARIRLARVMRAVYDRVGQYLFALFLIYAGVAAVSAAALAVIGLPDAVMWGATMGLAAFIPFIGSPIVIALVTAVAAFSFDDWERTVAAPVALIVIHVLESQFITPAVVGKRLSLNTVAVFVAIALLGWMWGAIGALVAVPLLILLVTVAEQLRSMRWLAILLADGVAPPTPQEERRRSRKKRPPARK